MSHEFVQGGFRKPAWHQLGIVKPEGWDDAVHAVEDTGTDFPIRLEPAFIPDEDGSYMPVPGRYYLYRPAVDGLFNDPAIFDEVSERYEPVSNLQIAETLNDLSKQWPVSTVGVLGNGDRSFITLDMGKTDVGGYESEEFQRYLTVLNQFKNGGIYWFPSNIRVVCANTYRLALGKAEKTNQVYSISHASEPLTILGFLAQVEEAAIQAQNLFFDKLDKMMTVNLEGKKPVQEFLEKVLPEPTVPRIVEMAARGKDLDTAEAVAVREKAEARKNQWENDRERVMKGRVMIAEEYNRQFDEGDMDESLHGSLYAWHNAANTFWNWGPGRGDSVSRAKAIAFGSRDDGIQKSFRVASEFLNRN